MGLLIYIYIYIYIWIQQKAPGINSRRKADYPIAHPDLISVGSCNDISSKGILGGIGGDVGGTHSDYIMEMGPITKVETNQIEELALGNACGEDIGIDTAAERIGQLSLFILLFFYIILLTMKYKIEGEISTCSLINAPWIL